MVLAHQQDVGLGALHAERVVHRVDKEDVAGTGGEGVRRCGEGADDVDGDDGASDVGQLPPRQESDAGQRSASSESSNDRSETFGVANDDMADADVFSK